MDTIEKALRKHQASKDNLARKAEEETIQSTVPMQGDQAATPVNNRETVGTDVPAGQQDKSAKKDKATPACDENGFLNLDLEGLSKLGVIMPDDKRSKIKEEYKHIKRPLLQKAAAADLDKSHKNLIMVTSAYSGEGKTFSSLNLAMSIAVERDRRVLLVDADVVKPGLDKMLEMEDRPGLVEYLSGDVSSFSDILLTTNVHNLTIVPAGKTHHLSHELLASNAMQELAHEMSTRYSDRIIIFDCPPMLITSEAKVLAKLVGQIVLVVEQDKTSQSAVKDAIALLERDKLTGLVLNKSKSVGESYYGYYYSEDK
ncbi:MAG: tyrosine-protein kinase family protein [Pseudomonadales bacterium]|nr:tyrosine-protein kinase family protein [Pseudomonadales bacterium]